MDIPFILNGIGVGLSEDKKSIKIDLYAVEAETDMQDGSKPHCSFIIPSAAYNTLIATFIKAGKSMQDEGVKLDLSEVEFGEQK